MNLKNAARLEFVKKSIIFENLTKMFSRIWRKAKKKNMKKERKFGLKEFPKPITIKFGGKPDWNAYLRLDEYLKKRKT